MLHCSLLQNTTASVELIHILCNKYSFTQIFLYVAYYKLHQHLWQTTIFLFFTKVTITGVRCFSTLSPSPFISHLTGFCNRCHQVLIIRVSPAPPADLRLAAAGNHCPVPLVSNTSHHQKTRIKVEVSKGFQQVNQPVDNHRDPLPGSKGCHTLQFLVGDPYWDKKLLRVAGAQPDEDTDATHYYDRKKDKTCACVTAEQCGCLDWIQMSFCLQVRTVPTCSCSRTQLQQDAQRRWQTPTVSVLLHSHNTF